jgi:hypothetical protein
MEHLDWNEFLDEYLTYGQMSAEDYYKLNDEQKFVINEVKKSFKRFKAKNNENI